jgi:urease accessory protein
MGESMNEGKLIDRWRVRRGGTLVFAETLRLENAIAGTLARSAAMNGVAAIATVLLVPGSDDAIAKVRALGEQFGGEVGISAWNGIAVARLCARDGATLRRDRVAALAALDRKGLPRLWLN